MVWAEAEETIEHQAYNTVCVCADNHEVYNQRVFSVRYELRLRNRCTLIVSGKVVNQ